ncbi:hypothetical protein [Mesorhizobium carmichaelinearum]|uniref:hypothetical protein n=1 Tax=Mesorhizobium carmichaelinearum TaxID=1208188 RepID=UPI000BA48273|nr:hypothetical protein [Mesorhizobium carmichaelinearum]
MDSLGNGMALTYAKNYWDVGNQLVVLMFGLAFAVYYALVQYDEVRRLVSKYNFRLLRLTIISNVFLLIVLWFMNMQESALASLVRPGFAGGENIVRAVEIGFWIRSALLVGNTVLYIIVLKFVERRIDPATGKTIVPIV